MTVKFSKIAISRKKLFAVAAILSLLAAVVYTLVAIESQDLPAVNNAPAPVSEVSVVEVKAETHQARLQGNGEARPHFELTLTAEVTGRITEVNPVLESGQLLDTETVLATIDAIPFEQGVATAKQSLTEAEVALLEAQGEAERARDEWQGAGLGNAQASPLLLRKPQLEAAQARIEQAKAMLKQAERDLAYTHIKAPFEAVVVERLVAPGQYVQAGDAIATLYSVDRIDVRVSLPLQQWALLPDEAQLIGDENVLLTSTTGAQWSGVVTHIDRHVDRDSRQRSLVVSVYQPLQQSQPLLAGTFLQAEFHGARREGLLAIPASSLTSRGDIWHVTDANRLSSLPAQVVFQQEGILFVKAPTGYKQGKTDQHLVVLTTPLPSYVPGQQVNPQFDTKVGLR